MKEMQDTRAKARALALLGAMAAVSAVLWQWPAHPGEPGIVTRSDVVLALDADVHQLRNSQLHNSQIGDSEGDQGPRQNGRIWSDRRASAASTSEPVPEPGPALIAGIPRSIAPGSYVGRPLGAEPLAVASRPLTARSVALAHPLRPAIASAPGHPPVGADVDDDGFGHAAAQAGVAIGSAFKQVGLRTASAFTRIF